MRAVLEEAVRTAEKEQLSYVGFLAELLLAEVDDRDRRSTIRRVQSAGFPRPKFLDDIDYDANPNLNAATITIPDKVGPTCLDKPSHLQLGEAVVTSAGQLTTARSLIHVAGLNLLWRASPRSVALSVHSAVEAAVAHRFATITMPLIGAGHGHLSADASRSTIHAALGELRHVPLPQPLAVRIVELPAAAA